MPEGVEVRVMSDQLNKILAGRRLLKFSLMGAPFTNNPKPRYAELRRATKALNEEAESQEIKITRVNNKGKYMYFELTYPDGSRKYLLGHVGMAGHWQKVRGEHTLAMLYFMQGDEIQMLYYDDHRHFGNFYLLDSNETLSRLALLGPDVLSRGFTRIRYDAIMARPRLQTRQIGELLLDQKVLSGIGNYLRADILYVAKISPFREVRAITPAERERLYKAILKVSKASYAAGGTTIATYKNVESQKGDYKPIIYGKKKDTKGNEVTSEEQGGRTIHWVKAVQT